MGEREEKNAQNVSGRFGLGQAPYTSGDAALHGVWFRNPHFSDADWHVCVAQ